MPQGHVKFGAVAYFNPEKGFGFINSDEGSKVYFHIRGRGCPRMSDRPTRFYPFLELVPGAMDSLTPQKGDRVCFDEWWTSRGWKADPWTFESEWVKAQPKYIVVRRREIIRKGRLVPDEAVEFIGTLEELEAKHPKHPNSDLDVFGPIFGQTVSTLFFFQIQLLGEEPKKCDDPRRVVYESRRSLGRR